MKRGPGPSSSSSKGGKRVGGGAAPPAQKRAKKASGKGSSSTSSSASSSDASVIGGSEIFGILAGQPLPSREEAESFFARMLAPLTVDEFEENFEGKQVLVANNEDEDETGDGDGGDEKEMEKEQDDSKVFVRENVFGEWSQLAEVLEAHKATLCYKDDVLVLPSSSGSASGLPSRKTPISADAVYEFIKKGHMIRFFNLSSLVPALARLLALTDAFWGASGASLEVVVAPVATNTFTSSSSSSTAPTTFDFSNLSIPTSVTSSSSLFEIPSQPSSTSSLSASSSSLFDFSNLPTPTASTQISFDMPSPLSAESSGILSGAQGSTRCSGTEKREELNVDIFVFQCEGSQLLRTFTKRPLRQDKEDEEEEDEGSEMDMEEMVEETEEYTLHAGDFAYIPKQTAFILTPLSNMSKTHSLHVLLAPSRRATWSDLFKETLNSAVSNLDKENVEARKTLPLGYLQYMGIVHSDNEDDPRRNYFHEQVGELLGNVLDIDSGEGRFKISQWIDNAADKFAKASLLGRPHFELGDWMRQYDDLRERVNQNGGLLKISNFLPEPIARRILHTFETMTQEEWLESKAIYDPTDPSTYNNAEHRFMSSKVFPNSDAILGIFSQQLLKSEKKKQKDDNDLEDVIENTFQAARYLGGDHIAAHDDKAFKTIGDELYSRELAVIYYLTEDWKEEYGGLLEDLEGEKTYVPEFNSLIAFNVPRDHVVTPVTGNRPRYSIFGWMLRKGRLYEMPVDEAVSEEDAAQRASDEPQDGQDTGKENETFIDTEVGGSNWISKRDRELFEWMIGGTVSVEDFFDKYWEQEPLLVQRNQDKDYYAGLITKDELTNDLLKRFDIQFTRNLDITSYQDGKRRTHNPDGRAQPEVVQQFLKDGCSVRMLNPATYCDGVWALLEGLQEYFGYGMGANVYLTPSSTQGFSPHYDDIEAFVLQLEGSKRWRMYTPLDEASTLPRYSSRNFEQNEIGEPVMDVVLHPGDFLYFPRGWIHQAVATEDPYSLHLTVSTAQCCSWIDMFEKMAPRGVELAEEEFGLVSSLPRQFGQFLGSGKSKVRAFREPRGNFLESYKHLLEGLLAAMPVDLAADRMGVQYIHNCLPPYFSQEEKKAISKSKEAKLTEDNEVRLLRRESQRLVVEAEMAVLYYASRNPRTYDAKKPQSIEFQLDSAPAIEFILINGHDWIRLGDLPLESWAEKEVLARTFILNDMLVVRQE